ncbi:hypothetical protein BC629DRAFT_1549277, partial [Irpex lacteus]
MLLKGGSNDGSLPWFKLLPIIAIGLQLLCEGRVVGRNIRRGMSDRQGFDDPRMSSGTLAVRCLITRCGAPDWSRLVKSYEASSGSIHTTAFVLPLHVSSSWPEYRVSSAYHHSHSQTEATL